LGYGLLSLLRAIIGKGASGALAANLAFVHWDLDRKLREQYRIFGAADDEAWRIGEINRAVLTRTALSRTAGYAISGYTAKNTFDVKRFAATIIEKNYLQDDFRRLIGINHFNDVTWFNKEAYENALFYGKLFYVLEDDSAFVPAEIGTGVPGAPGASSVKGGKKAADDSKPLPWLERSGFIAEIADAFKTAEAASGYQLDKLIHLLDTKKTAVKKLAATKSSAAKPAAKKSNTAKPVEKKPAAKKSAEKPAAKSVAKKPAATKTKSGKGKKGNET
jgi:hypothetical protein